MNALLILFIMMAIGAAIGGITNFLAIKMLFRPYKAIYLGSWRVPFTPGLIPKRRAALADQMGRMVVTHLLTPEGITQKIGEQDFQDKMISWARREIKRMTLSERSIEELINQYFQTGSIRLKIKDSTEQYIYEKIDKYMKENKDAALKEAVPPGLKDKVNKLIPELSLMITEKGSAYFQSEAGRQQLYVLLRKFLNGKGSMFNFLGSMFGEEKIVEKLQPEIVKFFEDPASEMFIRQYIQMEWEKLQEQPFSIVSPYVDADKISGRAAEVIDKEIPIMKLLETPLRDWVPRYEDKILNKWLPSFSLLIQNFLGKRLHLFFEELNLQEVVKQQVNAFSVGRLEVMVLSISAREFKMITYLGGFLGGTVGLLQGIFVLIFM
ncbi:DUF445 domain-containing protein [Alteribacillus sp. HJP-4]|uniref:DUF445 domain-containing protein n=1 Tax=Alteribacillus sp. HJP-4 TaxID=2775394 RepID=UPI0035CCF4EB